MRTAWAALVLGLVACHRTTRPPDPALDDCRACLARGGTWQGRCTANCELQDTFCFRTECHVCAPQTCSCHTAESCELAGCRWNVAGEAMWCTPRNPEPPPLDAGADLAPSVDAGVPDLPPEVRCGAVPPLGAQAVRWVAREVGAGFYNGPYAVTTQTLDVGPKTARLVVQTLRAPARSAAHDFTDERPVGPWSCESERVSEASVVADSRRLRLRFDSGELQCVRRSLSVAPAGARRKRVPTKSEECKASRWLTARRVNVEVLTCRTPGSVPVVQLFARDPGVERVTFDEDCELEGALRVVPADGGILPAVRLSEQPADLQRAFGPAP